MSKVQELLTEAERVFNSVIVDIKDILNEYLVLIKLYKTIKEQHETGVHFDDEITNVLNELEELKKINKL